METTPPTDHGHLDKRTLPDLPSTTPHPDPNPFGATSHPTNGSWLVTEYPTLGRRVATFHPTPNEEVRTGRDPALRRRGPTQRTGTPGAAKQDEERVLRRAGRSAANYVIHNRLTESFTLTFDDVWLPADWPEAQERMRDFVKQMRGSSWTQRRTSGLPFIYVISVNGIRGRFHVHLCLPIGFQQEHVQEWWPYGAAEKTGSWDHEDLAKTGWYLAKNMHESKARLPPKTNAYHVANGFQPPKKKTRFATEADLLAAMHRSERSTTTYWQSPPNWAWDKCIIRDDGLPPLDLPPPGPVGLMPLSRPDNPPPPRP